MSIPNPDDPTTSAAYVDPEGTVRVQAGLNAPQTAVGVVGFVVNMVMLWKGLAADKPKGWVIESAPAGSYLKIASTDGEMGASGGSATAVDHVHTGAAHTHSHSHSLSAHTHPIDHDHPQGSTNVAGQTSTQVLTGSGLNVVDYQHNHIFNPAALVDTSGVPSSDTTNANAAAASAENTGGVVTTPIALTPLFYGLYLIRYTGAP